MLEFSLSEKEYEEWKAFDEEHQECSDYTGAVGVSPVETTFVATSVGHIVKVRCGECGKEKNITDYDRW